LLKALVAAAETAAVAAALATAATPAWLANQPAAALYAVATHPINYHLPLKI
jgi:hypothetical protein